MNIIEYREISPHIFEVLLKKLETETDPSQKLLIRSSLSKALLQQNGFKAYYNYLSTLSEDNYECIQLFCKVILNRPSCFSNNKEYLDHSRQNFVDIIEFMFNEGKDQNLKIFITKIFYFLRRNQDLDQFVFIFEALGSRPGEIDLILFDKLCSWNFYPEELRESFYLNYFDTLAYRYLESDSDSENLKTAIRSGAIVIKSRGLCSFLEKNCSKNVAVFLNLWKNEKDVPIFIKTLLTPITDNALFESDKNIESFTIKNLLYAEKCSNQNESPCEILEFQKATPKTLEYEPSELDEIMTNLSSTNSTDMAYGLHLLRKRPQSNYCAKNELLEAVMSCLLSDDSFVYTNAIKTCISIGKLNSSPELLQILMKTANLTLNNDFQAHLIRFTEIFDGLLIASGSCAISSWTIEFVVLCSKYIQSNIFEVRCAIIKYYLDVLNYDYNSFIVHQKIIWNSFGFPSSKYFLENDIESEAIFKLINTYIEVILKEGRYLAADEILCVLDNFLRKAVASGSSQIVMMARSNLIELERIRQLN